MDFKELRAALNETAKEAKEAASRPDPKQQHMQLLQKRAAACDDAAAALALADEMEQGLVELTQQMLSRADVRAHGSNPQSWLLALSPLGFWLTLNPVPLHPCSPAPPLPSGATRRAASEANDQAGRVCGPLLKVVRRQRGRALQGRLPQSRRRALRRQRKEGPWGPRKIAEKMFF